MLFVPTVNPEIYESFVQSHPTKSHFMQSVAWGQFNEKQRGRKAHYVGMQDDSGSLVAAALLLECKPPLFPLYYYAPRGYVIDFFDKPLVAAFTKEIRAFAKERGAMFVALDPDVELWEIDQDAHHKDGGFDNHILIANMKSLGYKHRGYNKEFEGRQPRYTFRIDLTRDQSEIDKGIVGNVMKNVRKSHSYALDVQKGASGDVADLYRLIAITGERDAFVGYDKSYYQDFFDILSAHNMATLWIGTAYPKQTVALLEQSKQELLQKRETIKKPGPLQESQLTEQRIDREIELFRRYAAQYPNGTRISAHLVVHYGGKAWAVHAGSDKMMSETFLNNRVYYEKLCDAKQRGARLLDQFGTVGNPGTSHLKSLHEFKRQFGGRYIEFVGEFDLVLKPFWFFLYEKVLPLYRRIRISLRMMLRRSAGSKANTD